MVFVIDYHTHEAAAVRDMVLTVPDVAVTKFVLYDVSTPVDCWCDSARLRADDVAVNGPQRVADTAESYEDGQEGGNDIGRIQIGGVR